MKDQDKAVGAISGQTQGAVFFGPTYEIAKPELEWLTMSDGVKLAVTYFIPKPKTDDEKFPIVLEMLPYRKDDSFYQRDYPIYAYLARRGIAGARVDVRGTGSSEGRTPEREYSDAELNDIIEVINKLAALPWSNGNIGMQGISWSTFNALMTAMRNPPNPNLKAILVAHGSEDLFGNDVHYIDGCLHIDLYMLQMETENMVPRPPNYAIDEAYFNNRFNAEPWIFTYLRNYRDGDFWRKGRSLFTDYDSIKIPVLAIGALLDGYRDYLPNMLANIKDQPQASPPRFLKGVIGTWNHDWPDEGVPGPNYEWRQTAVRWWQKWLNGQETGVTAEPRLTVFVRGLVPPDLDLVTTPGYYRCLDWPLTQEQGLAEKCWYPQKDHTLCELKGEATEHTLSYEPDAGIAVGNWWGEKTGDMRLAEDGCLVYQTLPLKSSKCILGFPRVQVTVSVSAPPSTWLPPLANWVARLEDVNPDGTISLVTGGLMSGLYSPQSADTQKEWRLHPKPIKPDTPFTIEFPMRFTTWTFEEGHRIRLVISNAQFPMVWPTPFPMTTTLKVGDGSTVLQLPILMKEAEQKAMLPVLLPQPQESAPDARQLVDEEAQPFKVVRDPEKGTTTASMQESFEWTLDSGKRHYSTVKSVAYTVNTADPASASFLGEGEYTVEKPEKTKVKARAEIRIDSDANWYHVRVKREIHQNDTLVKEREWAEDIPRDFGAKYPPVPIYRYHRDHQGYRCFCYSTNSTETLTGGWLPDGAAFFAFGEGQGADPVYQYHHEDSNHPLRYCYTIDWVGPGWTKDKIAFYAFKQSKPGTTAVYQYYQVIEGGYWNLFYSTKQNEPPQGAGWTCQGPAFYVYA